MGTLADAIATSYPPTWAQVQELCQGDRICRICTDRDGHWNLGCYVKSSRYSGYRHVYGSSFEDLLAWARVMGFQYYYKGPSSTRLCQIPKG